MGLSFYNLSLQHSPLLNIQPAFRFPLVEILNNTTPWHLNVYDSIAEKEEEKEEGEGEEGEKEEQEGEEEEEREEQEGEEEKEGERMRHKRDVGGSLLASCGGTFRYSKSQEVTKICRLSWLTNSVLVYEPNAGGGGRGSYGVPANDYICIQEPK
jgi:hypothetical protein